MFENLKENLKHLDSFDFMVARIYFCHSLPSSAVAYQSSHVEHAHTERETSMSYVFECNPAYLTLNFIQKAFCNLNLLRITFPPILHLGFGAPAQMRGYIYIHILLL